jgi:hypothetical protein
MTGTQTVTVNIQVTGPQAVKVTATDEGPGSTITVTTGLTMVNFYDGRAVEVYTGAWLHPVDIIGGLPAAADPKLHTPHLTWATRKPSDKIIASGPSILIGATGTDYANHVYDSALRALRVRIGNVTWLVTDRLAYDAMASAYRTAHQMARIVFGPDRG